MLTPLKDEVQKVGDLAHEARRFRTILWSFEKNIDLLFKGTGLAAEVDHEAGHPIGKVLAILCFALVVIGIALGITYIVATGFGKTLSFQNFYPTLVSK